MGSKGDALPFLFSKLMVGTQLELALYIHIRSCKFVLPAQFLQFLTINPIFLIEFLKAFKDGLFDEDRLNLVETRYVGQCVNSIPVSEVDCEAIPAHDLLHVFFSERLCLR